MLIDGFTVVAQIINFLILVWLLKRFLYGPIVRAMREREERIAAQLAEAEGLKQKALAEAEDYRRQRAALAEQEEELLLAAREEAEAKRKELIQEARREIDEARAAWRKSVEAEKREFIREMRQRAGQLVAAISRRALADLADTELEERMAAALIRRIRELDEAGRQDLIAALERSRNRLILRSSFALQPAARERLVQFIGENMPAAAPEIHFESNPDLLCGIEISAQDYKLAWTLDDYLRELETSLLEALDGETAEPEEAEKVYAG